MSLPPGFLDELRTRVSLAQLAGRKLSWDRKSNAGKGDYWAPCPFHQEKSASFHVDDAKGYYYCFGCGAKGDAVTYLRETENLGFIEAVEQLAIIAGMPMPARDPAAAAKSAAQMGLVEAMEAAVQFYRLQLNTARASEARSYLDRRRLSPATLERFEIGFAPDSRTALMEHLTGKGFPRERLVEAGLVGTGDGGAYDRFRGRIMFPIRDARGRAIGFGARALREDQQPKYLNSPETPLFDKGRTLYNIAPARAAAGKAGTVIVVEGYMDVIALAQAGFEHAVAPLGTAITETQLRLFWRITPEPVVALDGDTAGMRAAQRLIDLALPMIESGKSLRFALMPPGQDPDDVVRAGGAAAMQALVGASAPMLDLLWRRETEGAVLDSPERRAALDARLRGHLGRIADANLRAHYEAEIKQRRAALFAPPERDWRPRREFTGGKTGGKAGARKVPQGGATAAARGSLLARAAESADAGAEARIRESAILLGCLNHPDLALGFEDQLERMRFHCDDLGEIRDALLSALSRTLNDGGSMAVCDLVHQRLGRNVLGELDALGHVNANPHLRASSDPEKAAIAIAEELTRHAALAGLRSETREAESELSRESDDLPARLAQRLRQAAEAAHGAYLLSGDQDDVGEERSAFASNMASVEAMLAQKKPRKR